MATPAPNVLNFTGERFAPEVRGAIWYEHWHRYCVAQPLAAGKSVLDAACGEGYGSYLLAQTAREVVGIDISAEAVTHAQSRYAAPNLRYVEGSCTALPLAAASVDLVISFETIEHLQQQSEMLAEFRRVLAPGGVLVISSPNPPVYSEKLGTRNEYHVRELTRKELTALLKPVFPQQAWYGQRVIAHSAVWAEKPGRTTAAECSLITLVGDEIRAQDEPAPPMYFVVVCAAKGVRLPSLPSLSLFDDGKQSLYNDYGRALIREKELYWQELDARKIAEDRLGDLIATTNDLASLKQEAGGLRNRLSVLEDAFDTTKAELDTERQYNNALTWEERNARNVAEARLTELITHVNNFSSERARSESLAARVASLEQELQSAHHALTEERGKQAAVEWEERNSRKIAEDRLAELITVTNADREKVASLELEERNARTVAEQRLNELIAISNSWNVERDRAASLEAQANSLLSIREVMRAELDAAKAQLVTEQQARAAAEWENRDALKTGNDRLAELITTVNALNSEREKNGALADRILVYEAALAAAQSELAQARTYLSSVSGELETSRAHLAAALAELERSNAQVVNLNQAFTGKAAELTELEGVLAATRAALDSAQAEIDTAAVEINSTHAQLAAALAARDSSEAERVAALAWRDAAMAERDSMHGEWGAALALREGALVERDAAFGERDAARAAFDAAHTELEAAWNARNEAFAQRDVASAERALASSQRDAAWAERDAAQAERDAAQAERHAAHAGWNGAFVERNAALAERDRALNERNAYLEQRDAAYIQMNSARAEVAVAAAQLNNLNAELRNAHSELVNARAVLSTTQAELAAARSELRAAGSRLEDTLSELGTVTADLRATRAEQGAAAAELSIAGTELSTLRPQYGRALMDIAILRAELEGARGDIDTAGAELSKRDHMLAEVQARLRFRETFMGWLRWPLARLRGLRRSASKE